MIETQYYRPGLSGLGYQAVSLPKGKCVWNHNWHHRAYPLHPEKVVPPGRLYEGKQVSKLQSFCGDDKVGEPFFFIRLEGDIVNIASFGLTYEQLMDADDYAAVTEWERTGGTPSAQASLFGDIDTTTILMVGAVGVAAVLLLKK